MLHRARAPPSDRLNVLLVIVDSVRTATSSRRTARRASRRRRSTPASPRRAARFTRFFPEAMPTVPARRALMTGRRAFPFRGWERAPDLGRGPGAAPIEDVSRDVHERAEARGLLDRPPRATTRSSGSRGRSGRSGSASTATCPSRATAGSATTPRRSPDEQSGALAAGGAQRRRPLRGGHPQVPRQHRLRRGRLGVERGARLQGEHEAARGGGGEAAVRPGGGLLRPARALEPGSRSSCAGTRTPSYHGASPGTARYTRAATYLDEAEVRQMRAVYAGGAHDHRQVARRASSSASREARAAREHRRGVVRATTASCSATAAGPARSRRSCTLS